MKRHNSSSSEVSNYKPGSKNNKKGKKALIIVDVQNDFSLPDSPLYVLGGETIQPKINKLIDSGKYDHIVWTMDWHPSNHWSFLSNMKNDTTELCQNRSLKMNPKYTSMAELKDKIKQFDSVYLETGQLQIMWPDHCIQGTEGARIMSGYHQKPKHKIIYKGEDTKLEQYSGFAPDNKLKQYLDQNKVVKVDVVGLALDYFYLQAYFFSE